jgi:predicted N-acetyltransferase YhbS
VPPGSDGLVLRVCEDHWIFKTRRCRAVASSIRHSNVSTLIVMNSHTMTQDLLSLLSRGVCRRGGQWMPSPRVMLRLLGEAEGVPLIFATVALAGGHVFLQEMSDGLQSLDWSTLPLDCDCDPHVVTAGGGGEGAADGGGDEGTIAVAVDLTESEPEPGPPTDNVMASRPCVGDTSVVDVRTETTEDYAQTEAVVEMAFRAASHSSQSEHVLVKDLRQCQAAFVPELSFVATVGAGDDRKVVGHVMLTRVRIVVEAFDAGEHSSSLILALAPLSVVPDMQRKGVGKLLVTAAHNAARDMGFSAVIILGDPEYYSRFGYSALSRHGIKLPFSVPDEFCMGIELVDGALGGLQGGIVEYSPPFNK